MKDELYMSDNIVELPKRKQIRLKNYDYSRKNVYYITICTHNRVRLFGEIVGATLCGRPNDPDNRLFGEIVGATLCGRPNNPDKMIVKWLFELENKYPNTKIDKYVIMPDHIHFIISNTGDHAGSPLPQMIDWFKTMTTNEYIRGVKNNLFPPFDKHIWQRNYYEHIIRDENEYKEIWQYIDNNPLKWKIDHDG